MKYKIHFNEDSFVIEGDTIEEIREKAYEELSKRNIDVTKITCWSEALE